MKRMDQAGIAVVALAWVGVAFGASPKVTIDLAPNTENFYIGETNTVTNRIRFRDDVYKSVKVTLYPTIDVPDVVITKVTFVEIGGNLKITGNAEPVMDWGIEHFQVPGKALSCEIDLGDVIKLGKAVVPEADTITIQYEAMVLGQVPEFTEVGHQHDIAAAVDAENARHHVISILSATFAYRSLPLLFRGQDHSHKAQLSRVVEMNIDPKKSRDADPKVFAY